MPRNTQLQNVVGSDGNLGPKGSQSSALPLPLIGGTVKYLKLL